MEARPPAQQSDPTTANRLALSEALALIGLEEYEERLIQNGFEDWETLAAITEADMEELGFKLGDRRKLQHSIRDQGHLLFDSSVEYWNIISPSRPSLRRLSNLNQPSGTATSSSSQAQHPPRQYRRHPRPDPNAPPRPKTAYVLFSEQIRNDPEWKVASFTEVAKEAGRRWRDLPPEIRSDVWEEPATERFQAYREDLGRYKQTEEYRDYQEYQEKFEQDQRQSSRAKGRSNDKATSVLSGPAEPEEQEGARRMSILQIAASEGQDEDTPLPVRPGLDEVRHIRAQLGISPDMVGTEFPDEQETYKAVEAFLAGTGSLLYLWDQDAARSLVRSVYESRNEPPLAYTEVFAMAAVGSYCDGEGHSPSVHEKFLHLFISTLSTSSGMISDLRSMRVFACLAICRFTDNVESSRALILSALNIGRQILTSQKFLRDVSEEGKVSWWTVFRSIIFLESWFSYNTSHESRVIESDLTFFTQPPTNSPQSYQSVRPTAEHASAEFHPRISELGQLAAYIALDLKTGKHPKAQRAQAHFETLERWHRTLPPPVRLSRLSLDDPSSFTWQTKRCLLQLHILFLGTKTLDQGELNASKAVEEQCVLAARQSARVASLLQTSKLIRSRCWVSVYTSYTACAILMYSASQKLLSLLGEEVSQDLLYASSHLSILSFCGFNNPVAQNLFNQLQIFFNDIREIVVSKAYLQLRELHSNSGVMAVAPLLLYGAAEQWEGIVEFVLEVTKRILEVLENRLSTQRPMPREADMRS